MRLSFAVIALIVSSNLCYPAAFARGGFGGFGGGGGHSFSGFGHSGGGFSGFGHSGGFGGRESSGNFGGGFNSMGGGWKGGGGGDHSFGGGAFGGGDHSFGGAFGGGGDHSFGGGASNRPGGGGWNGAGNRPDGGGGWSGNRPNGGGGWNGGGNRPDGGGGWSGNRPNGGGGWNGGNHPDQPISGNHFPTDGGMGHFSNWNNHDNNFNHFDNNNFNSNNVRNSYNNFNQFNHYGGYGGYGYHGYGYGGYGYHGAWWGYPGGWYCPGWSSATAWTFMGLSTLTSFLGIAALAGSGGGGKSNQSSVTNISYNGGNVYVDGSSAGTEADYYNQALALANTGSQYASVNEQDENTTTVSTATTPGVQWQSLGVFSLAAKGQSQSTSLIQLAINKEGVVRGNYFNQITNDQSEVYGSLDKKTQRISFKFGQNSTTVFDTSLHDIGKEDVPVLVHYGPDNTQSMMLVRLKEPKQNKST